MQSELVGIICKMGIFMICAQAIVHFRPKLSYEKYLKLLVSAMLLVQIFLFVGGIFSSKGKQELTGQIQWFTRSMEENIFFSEENWIVEIMGEEKEDSTREQIEKIEIRVNPIEHITIGTVE